MKATGLTREYLDQSNNELIDKLKVSLLLQKSSILNKSHEFRTEQCNYLDRGDEAELASVDANTSISIHLLEKDKKALLAIETALRKIEAGTYGQCSCGEMISAGRLKASPFTALCIDCMEEQESHTPIYQ